MEISVSRKKKNTRIRQTRTDWQKTFDPHPGIIQPFSWHDRLPELLHISMCLVNYDFKQVKEDFVKISDYINLTHNPSPRFHFNLSHTVRLIKEDLNILRFINETCFKSVFEILLIVYEEIFEIGVATSASLDLSVLFKGYENILNGRSSNAILCKYIMVQYTQMNSRDVLGLLSWDTKEDILKQKNISTIMAIFPPSVGLSENIDLDFCEDIWFNNYMYSPPIFQPDHTAMENEQFKEMNIDELASEFRIIYEKFKTLNLIAVYNPFIAEINMGFVARICNLGFDIVDLTRNHKGEIADLVLRSVIENFIVGSWLLTKADINLHKRFRDFHTGKQRFMGEKLIEKSSSEKIKVAAKQMIVDAIDDAGVRDVDVATERGDAFDINIGQMSDEVWGKDNMYYLLYKRLSEVTHGGWGTMAKHHLSQSLNPMHRGLFFYNENPNHFSGMPPAFVSIGISSRFLLTVLDNINLEEIKEFREQVNVFYKKQHEQYKTYFNKYVLPDSPTFADDIKEE
ncbi:hypothetical protein BH09BAC1_BH09BAC1_07470 [soil metagenome]